MVSCADACYRRLMRAKAGILFATGGLLLSLTAGTGIASAQGDLGAIINTTCSYPQVVAALTAQDPAAASQFNSSPMAMGVVQDFLGSSIAERQVTAQRLSSMPAAQEYLGLMQQVAGTCNNF